MHARLLVSAVDEIELVAIADANGQTAQRVAADVRVERWTDDPEQLIADDSVEAVIIASSTDTHAPLIAMAAAAGKHVFCEKPIALDLESTDATNDIVDAAGIILQVGFQRRFDAGYRRAKAMIDNGSIGRVEHIRDIMLDPEPPTRDYIASSGGMFRDLSIHNFDAVRWLMADEVEDVYAVGTSVVDPMFAELGDIDTAIITLRFAGGGLASIQNGRRSGFGYDVRTEVFGSTGAVWIGYQAQTPVVHLSAAGVTTDHVPFFMERFRDAYVAELNAFARCVRAGGPSPIDGHDARAAMATAYAAERSRSENRPVRLDEFAPERGSR
jgi:inositol 2-dehydrogenase